MWLERKNGFEIFTFFRSRESTIKYTTCRSRNVFFFYLLRRAFRRDDCLWKIGWPHGVVVTQFIWIYKTGLFRNIHLFFFLPFIIFLVWIRLVYYPIVISIEDIIRTVRWQQFLLVPRTLIRQKAKYNIIAVRVHYTYLRISKRVWILVVHRFRFEV